MKVSDETKVDLSDHAEIVSVYKQALTEIARWEKIKDELNSLIKNAMGEASLALVNGDPVLRKTVVEGHRFDSKLFRDEFPELAGKYMIPTKYSKLTIVKPADDDT